MARKKSKEDFGIDDIEKLIDSMPETPREVIDKLPDKKLSRLKKRKVQKKTDTQPKKKRNLLKKLLKKNIVISWAVYTLIFIIIIGVSVICYNIGFDDGEQYQMDNNIHEEKLLNIFANVDKFVYIENNETCYHIWLDIYPWDLSYPVHMDISWFEVLGKPVRFHTARY